MTPVVPDANPPSQSIVETFGFHSPHVDMSDHTRQTFSGEAVVSTEVPYSRAIAQVLFFFRQTARRRTAHGQLDDVARLQEVQGHDADHQEHRTEQLYRAQWRGLSDRGRP